MNLLKLYKEELYTAVIMLIVFAYPLVNKTDPIKNNWLIGLIFLVMTWAIYYFQFIRMAKDLRLDEREMHLYTKTGHIATFVFLSILLALFVYQNEKLPFLQFTVKDLWGRFILPIFIICHAFTGIIILKIEEK